MNGSRPAMKKVSRPGLAVAALGDGDDRQVRDAELGEHRGRCRELALAAVDKHQVRPRPDRLAARPAFASGRGPASFRSRAKRRRITSRIIPKSSPGVMSSARMLNFR